MRDFEGSYAIDIFQGVFLTLPRMLAKSRGEESITNLHDLTDEELDSLVPIVQETIEFIGCGYGHAVKDFSVKDKEYALRTIHAALFYHAIKSLDFHSEDLEDYYETLDGRFLSFDFSFYKKILIQCSFSQYFIECILQLPKQVAYKIVQKIILGTYDPSQAASFAINCSKHFLHMTAYPIENTVFPCFNFNFDLDEANTRSDDNVELALSSLESAMCYLLPTAKSVLNDSDLCRTVFDWLVDIQEILIDKLKNTQSFDSMLCMKPYFECIVKWSKSETVISSLKRSLQLFKNSEFESSVEIGRPLDDYLGYTLFQAYAKFQDLIKILQKSQFNFYDSIVLMMEDIITNLFSIHPLWSREDSTLFEENVEMLLLIVSKKLPGMKYACQVLLDKEFPVKKNRVFECLKKDPSSVSNDFLCMELLMDAAIAETSPEKEVYHKIFLDAFKKIPLKNQLCLLRLKMKSHGISSQLKLVTFDSQLLQCRNRSNLEQINFCLPTLCMQSSKEMVRQFVKDFVNFGSKRIIFIQALKTVDFICGHHDNDSSMSLLIKILQPFFTDKAFRADAKNIMQLLVELCKEFSCNDAFSLEEFFNFCILPNFELPFTFDAIKFNLEMLNVILEQSVAQKNVEWLNRINISTFVICLCLFIDFSIINLDGYLKEVTISILRHVFDLIKTSDVLPSQLENKQMWMQQQLSSMNFSVRLYVWNLVHSEIIDVTSLDLQDLILWFIISEESEANVMKDVISLHYQYKGSISIVTALTQALPHFTLNEYMRLAKVLEGFSRETYCERASELIDNAYNTELVYKKLHVIYVCEVLVDAFILLSACDDMDFNWPYMITCFSKAILELLRSVGMCAYTRCKILLEFCRLAENIQNYFDVLSITLRDILKSMKACDFRVLDTCKEYITAAERHLEKSVGPFDMSNVF